MGSSNLSAMETRIPPRAGLELVHHANDLFELGHELGAVLEPPGRIHEHHARAKLTRRLDGIISERRGVRALLARDDRAAEPLAPDLQLLDCRRAERIARGKQHLLSLARVARRACRSLLFCPSR